MMRLRGWLLVLYWKSVMIQVLSKRSVIAALFWVPSSILRLMVVLVTGPERRRLFNHLRIGAALRAQSLNPAKVSMKDAFDPFMNARFNTVVDGLGPRPSLIISNHSRYFIPSVAAALMDIVQASGRNYVSVAALRRVHAPEVEAFWFHYALALNIRIEFFHDDRSFLRNAKRFLAEGDVVVVLPDYLTAQCNSLAEGMERYRDCVELFARMARKQNAALLYLNSTARPRFGDREVLSALDPDRATDHALDLFRQEIAEAPENWAGSGQFWSELMAMIATEQADRHGVEDGHVQAAVP
ncbi:MAG: hypothetical protein WBB85_13735 [Albidovulum sp.]|uniref:hypothetical protein n=1 Tax=Albidovulum sp. TaxID=1872424 RepID=UPI003CBB95A7